MSQRTDRVDELLRQEIGVLLAKEVADPRIGFVTITDVETSPDLRHAKVWVSVIGGKTDQKETLRALQGSMGFIRHELGRTLRIRRIPDLHVHLDETAERGTRVLHLLHELEAGTDPEAIEPYAETLPRPVARLPHEGDAEPDAPAPGDAAEPSARPPGEGARARDTARPRDGSRPPSGRPGSRTPRGSRGGGRIRRRGPGTGR